MASRAGSASFSDLSKAPTSEFAGFPTLSIPARRSHGKTSESGSRPAQAGQHARCSAAITGPNSASRL
jgi:hypothetical protein